MNCRLPALREKTAKLTTSPGVYLMKNQKSEIIYVGKAKNLKNRVTSYFRESADHTPKVASMVEHVYLLSPTRNTKPLCWSAVSSNSTSRSTTSF